MLPARFVDVLRARWWIARGDAGRAADHLQARMPDLQAIGFPPLLAEAHAELADALLATERLDEAQTHTDAVLALSAGLPSGRPLLSARRTRYRIALARGDDRVALGELQAVLTAERAYEDEVRHLLAAYEAGRQESMARQQALALVEQRNAQLSLDALHSARTTTFFTLMAAPWAWPSSRCWAGPGIRADCGDGTATACRSIRSPRCGRASTSRNRPPRPWPPRSAARSPWRWSCSTSTTSRR